MPNFTLVNEKMLRVELTGNEIYAKKGAMVAYKGKVAFARAFTAGEGVQGMVGRAVTNESFQLMTAKGQGEIFYAHFGAYVTVIKLQGEMFYVESSKLLAMDSTLQTDTVFQGNQGVQGLVRGAVSGQGLFTTSLTGHGDLAILSDGNAIGLDVTAERPIFVDPNAYLGYKGNLQSQFVTDVNWKTLIGQSSGESYQLKFSGTGTVYIQASER